MRSLTVSLLLISFCVAQAQEDTLRFSAGTGWNYNVILDEAVSPMLYKGHGYSFQASMEKTKKKHSGRLSLTYQRARIQPGLENKSMEILYRGQLDWICVFRVKTASGFPVIHIGGHFLTSFHITDHEQWANNDFSHSFAFSLGPSLMANIPLFRKNKNLQLAWEFSFPLLDYVVRPGISSTLSEGTIKMGKSGTLATMTGRLQPTSACELNTSGITSNTMSIMFINPRTI